MSPSDEHDPLLTAYALGELPPDQRLAVEKRLQGDQAALAEVEQIRATASILQEALAGEPLPERAVGVPRNPRRSWLRRALAGSWTVWVPVAAAAAWAVYLSTVPVSKTQSGAPSLSVIPGQPAGVVALSAAPDPAPQLPAAAAPVPASLPGGQGESFKTPHFVTAARYPQFSLPVSILDTSYGDVRNCIERGEPPPAGMVRIEELLNHFTFRYGNATSENPVVAATEVHPAPWDKDHLLVRFGLQGGDVTPAESIHNTDSTHTEARAMLQQLAANDFAARQLSVQVDLNPAKVMAYRLLGYDGRLFSREGVDSADLPAGRSVTALLEIVPRAARPQAEVPPAALPDRKQDPAAWLTVTLRYQQAQGGPPRTVVVPLHALEETEAPPTVASPDFKFAASVAGFGLILQENPNKGTADWDMVEKLAKAGLADDPDGRRGEFVSLVSKARAAAPCPTPAVSTSPVQ